MSTNEVANYLDKMTSYSAKFKQVVFQNNQKTQDSTGKVILKKPIKFKWDYETPEKMQILSDGKNFFHYDIALMQVTVKPISEVANNGILLLLKDNNKINSSAFDISSIPNSDSELSPYIDDSRNLTYYRLIPNKSTDKSIKNIKTLKKNDDESLTEENIILGFNYDSQLSFVLFSDSFGVTVFYFSDISVNKDINNELFKFKVPNGVDILGDIL